MKLPDRIFAIGGAGKAIAFELLETQWVLDSVLEPKPSPESLHVTIVDTAQGEENSDRRRIQELRQRIRETEEELRDNSSNRTGSIEITYKLIVDQIQLNSAIDLIGDDTVPRIAAGNGMDEDDWWLNESHINENLDFAKGVVRKRGLGKAIYYKAYAEDDEISSVVDLPEKGEVAVIAGLGGGTGSGITLDLVQHLKRRQRTAEITLFGILPNKTEGIKENSNAFAALSEIEHLALEGEAIFKDRILLPIDPTGFDGKTGNQIQSQQFLEELDQAFVYLIASYYNQEDIEDPFASSPDFAPFTIGIPQVLRYNVEAISSARESIRNILEAKREAIDNEEQIYSEVERFLDRHGNADDEADAGLRDLDQTDLVERLERIESLVDLDLFEELEYEAVDIFKTVFRDAESESEDVMGKIDVIGGMLRAGATGGGDRSTFVDDIDEELAETIEQDLELLVRRKELLHRKQAIDQSQIRKSIEYLLGSGDDRTNPGVQITKVEAKFEDLEDREERLERDLEEAVDELESKRQEAEQTVQREVDDWSHEIESDFDQLARLSKVDPTRTIDELETQLEQFRTEVVNADEPEHVENASVQEIRATLDDLEGDLQQIGIDAHDERQSIDRSLSSLKNARTAFLKVNQEESTLESVVPWESSTEEERQEAQKDYRMQKTQLDDAGVFNVGPVGTSFSAEVVFSGDDLEGQIRDKERELEEVIVDSLRRRDVRQEHVRELERIVTPEVSLAEIEDVATAAFRDEVADTDDIQGRKSEIEAELEEARDDLELYEATTDLFDSMSGLRSSCTEAMETYEEQLAQYREDSARPVTTEEEDYVYIKNIQPNDLFRATGSESLAESDLFNSDEETRRLKGNLEELARNARNERYTGLHRRKLDHDGARYDGLKVRVATLSPAVNQLGSDTLDVEGIFQGSFNIDTAGNQVTQGYTTWFEEIGGPWDVGLTVFLDGVFLDNLRAVVDADGYYDGYMERFEELQEDIVVHHSQGLEEGYFVRRNDVLNLEDDQDVQFFLRDDDKSVADALLSEYLMKVETGDADVEGIEQTAPDDA